MEWLIVVGAMVVGAILCVGAYRNGKEDGYEQGWNDSYEYNKQYESKIGHGGKK